MWESHLCSKPSFKGNLIWSARTQLDSTSNCSRKSVTGSSSNSNYGTLAGRRSFGPSPATITEVHCSIHVDAHLAIVVYSVADRRTFEEAVNYWVPQVRDNSTATYVLVIGNKTDQESQITKEEAEKKCEELGCHHVRTSCREGTNTR